MRGRYKVGAVEGGGGTREEGGGGGEGLDSIGGEDTCSTKCLRAHASVSNEPEE